MCVDYHRKELRTRSPASQAIPPPPATSALLLKSLWVSHFLIIFPCIPLWKEIKIHFVYPLLYTLWIFYDSWLFRYIWGVAINDLFRHPAGVCAARVVKVRGKDGKSARWSDQFCFLSEPASLCWRCNAVSAPHTTHLTSGAGGGWGMSVLGRSPSSVSSCCVSVKPSWPKTSVEHSPYKRWSNEPSFGKGWALQVKHLHAGKR